MMKPEVYDALLPRFGEEVLREIIETASLAPATEPAGRRVLPARVRDRAFRDAVAAMVIAGRPQSFLTICLHRPAAIDELRTVARLLYLRIQDARFGKKRQLAEAYDGAWFFAEKIATNGHLHCFWRTNQPGKVSLDEALSSRPWCRQRAAVTYDHRVLDGEAAIRYSVKEVRFDDHDVTWFDAQQWVGRLAAGGR